MHGVGQLARQLADDAYHYGAPDDPIRHGDEADALKRAALKVSDDPINAEATAQLLRLALSVLRFDDSSPDGSGSGELERRMRDLIRILQSNVDREDRDEVADLIPDVVSEGERGEAVGNRLRGMMKRFGKPAARRATSARRSTAPLMPHRRWRVASPELPSRQNKG